MEQEEGFPPSLSETAAVLPTSVPLCFRNPVDFNELLQRGFLLRNLIAPPPTPTLPPRSSDGDPAAVQTRRARKRGEAEPPSLLALRPPEFNTIPAERSGGGLGGGLFSPGSE